MSPSARAVRAIQWSWKTVNWAGGSGSASSSSSRGNSDAAPVTQFATSSESMSEWLLARSDQYVVAIRSPLGKMIRWSLYTSWASPISRTSVSSLSGSQTSS